MFRTEGGVVGRHERSIRLASVQCAACRARLVYMDQSEAAGSRQLGQGLHDRSKSMAMWGRALLLREGVRLACTRPFLR